MGDGVAFGQLQLDIYPFRAGYPTKVLIGAVRRPNEPLSIRGQRCSDGRRLRFFYARNPAGQLDIRAPGPPYRASVLERAGQAFALLKPRRSPRLREWSGMTPEREVFARASTSRSRRLR